MDGDRLEHPAPQGMTLYYWPCSLLLLAPSLLLDRPTGPLAATLRIACAEPYMIQVGERCIRTRVSLVAPKAKRKRIAAIGSEIALFYLPLELPQYAGVRELLAEEELQELPVERFASVIPPLRRAMREVRPAAEIHALVQQVVELLTGAPLAAPQPDPRVDKAMAVLDAMPLSEVSPAAVAKQVHLSSSRLRELFRAQTGFSMSDYARWAAVWRAAFLWKRGLTMTEVAHQAGFHDLAHADRAFTALFGMNPSKVVDPKYVTLVNCGPPHPAEPTLTP
ncbi:MAG: helix-turn-helix domain-containing protein [Oceanococcaceae bacterium]